MDKKIDEYKDALIRNNLGKLKKECPLYREVRGDGNCFYRAAFYYYFEILLSQEDNSMLKNIIN